MSVDRLRHEQTYTPRRAGRTIVEALVVLAVIVAGLATALAAADKPREVARATQCANHLRLLAAAAHVYAGENEGKFFYHWGRQEGLDGAEGGAAWFDQKRLGNLIKSRELPDIKELTPVPESNMAVEFKPTDPGVLGGPMVCPDDTPPAARSYGFNFWAYGIGPDAQATLRQTFPYGDFFNTETDKADRLLLFAEQMNLTASRKGWITQENLGAIDHPGARFGGKTDFGAIYGGVKKMPPYRFAGASFSYQLDYTRHSTNEKQWVPVGNLNIAYMDGHVAMRSNHDLYSDEGKSTFQTLWSPLDEQIEEAQ